MSRPLLPIPARIRDLRGDVSPNAPTDGQVLAYNETSALWTPVVIEVRQDQVEDLSATLAAKAPISSPAFTGTVTAATIQGSTASGGSLILRSTSHTSKGKILLGSNSAFDEANNRLGIGTQTPNSPLNISLPGSQDFAILQATNSTYVQIKLASGSCQSVFGTDSAHGYFRTVTAHPFAISTNNSRRVYIEAASGLVSLGVYGFSVPTYTQDSRLQLDCATAGEKGLTINLFAGQTADALTFKTGSTVHGTVNENGYYTTRKTTAPADAELANSELAYWFDPTPGAARLMVKAKNSAGTVVTGSLNLT